MSQNLLSKFVLDDIVFDNRNQAYGAHYLRRIYDRIMSRSMVIGLIFIVLLVSSPMILQKLRSMIPQEVDKLESKVVEISDVPPMDPNKAAPPPPPKIDPPPIKDQIRFVPPKVMKDELVEIEEQVPLDITDLANKDISTENVEGAEDGVDKSLEESPPIMEEPVLEKTFEFVEQMPEFPDGQAAMMKYIQSKMNYPVIARENGIEGTVVVQFIISSDGGISKVDVARGIGGGCDEEAVRVVRSMPKWKPGKNNGKAVQVQFTLPIKFRLE